jgi:putative oxidoreductase
MANRSTEALPRAGLTSGRSSVFSTLIPILFTLLRIGTGLLFAQHGAQKLLGWFGGFGGTPGATAPLMSQMGLAGVLELVGGLLIALGLLTRPTALILVAEMIAAYIIAHLPQGGFPIENGGELSLFYALVFAFFFAYGAGPASLDRLFSRRRP